MSRIVDRRLDGKNKSAVNRQRFIRRFKGQMRKAMSDSLNGRSITEIDTSGKVNIPAKDLAEPTFGHGSGGRREVIHPGNKEFVKGDRMPRPQRGSGRGGSGSGQASDSGEGEDDFVFVLSQEEFSKLLFDGLELPNLKKEQSARAIEFESVRAGFSNSGSKLDVRRSLKRALGRRIGMGFQVEWHRLADARRYLLEAQEQGDSEREHELLLEIEGLERRARVCPFFDSQFDAQYVYREPKPVPAVSAVVFFIMDVSGSMGMKEKDLAKRFFMLLHLFLKRSYKKVEVVFIRHHTTAKEVDEGEFFRGVTTGGTVVSTALELMVDIQRKRFPAPMWSVYMVQASDGDNCNCDDSLKCRDILLGEIMPVTQYAVYLETLPVRHQSLWGKYLEVAAKYTGNFAMRVVRGPDDIYPTFCEIFKKRVH